MYCNMYQAMYVEKLYLNGCLYEFRNWYLFLWVLFSLDEISGARLRRSSDGGTSKIGTKGTRSEQSLTNRRFY